MRYGSFETLTTVLEERETEKNTAFLVSAQQKADEAYQTIVKEGAARLEQRKARFRKQLNARKKQEMIRISMSEQLRVNAFKQSLIDQELEKCVQYFHDLPDDTFFDWMDHFISHYEEQPVIYIGPARFESAKSRYGHAFQVKLKEDLEIGFLLAYDNFDVNQDMKQVMHYKKQEMTNRMMGYLFEDDA